jgi:hypothetical protein
MRRKLISAGFVLSCLLFLINTNVAIAAIMLPTIIGDNMILQRNVSSIKLKLLKSYAGSLSGATAVTLNVEGIK